MVKNVAGNLIESLVDSLGEAYTLVDEEGFELFRNITETSTNNVLGLLFSTEDDDTLQERLLFLANLHEERWNELVDE